jgi:hypothetical protein
MHSKPPNYVAYSKWDSQKKKDSRDITIVGLFREVFGLDKIPKDSQYWTMCGAHFNVIDGKLDGEFMHLIKKGLITTEQFFGVDREEEIIKRNQELYPDVRWIHGDFLTVMKEYYHNNNFNPVIINYDGVMQPKFGTQYLRDILKFLDYNMPNELLLTANFILTNPYSRSKKLQFTVSQTVEKLLQIYGLPKHWILIPQAYEYHGSSINNVCEMGVLMFIKQRHNINNIKWV